jgi:D-amino peptidase
MKVYISVDIEGCIGVINSFHTARTGDDFTIARRQMTREANAAVEGCLEAGATEVLLNDSHGGMVNLLLDELHPAAEVIQGNTKQLCMMEGISTEHDAAMYIGYHTAAGIAGTLSHTMASGLIYSVRLNGEVCSEFDINASVAGDHGVPSVLISGDDRLAASVSERYPQVHTATVKEYRSRMSNRSPHPSVGQQRIKTAAAKALADAKNIKPIVYENPVLELDMLNEIAADFCALIPGVEKTASRTIRYQCKNMTEATHIMMVILKTARV